jgi:prevent-host-death family protein
MVSLTRICYNSGMATHRWQVQEAKAEFSALIHAAEDDGPQTITRNGKAVAVVLSQSTFDRLIQAKRARRGTLLEFFAAWPALDIPARDRDDVGREVDL